jgi:hypothetical protein
MVDRVRSAYSSTWALPGNPAVQGQYYFVPEDTAPFESYLWSKHWRQSTYETMPEFGQIDEAPEYYSKGLTPAGECVPPWVIACGGGRYPQRIQVDMGPIADTGCNECAALAGVQVLEHQPGQCVWKGPLITFCSAVPGGPFTYQYQLMHFPDSSLTRLDLVKFAGAGPSFAFRAQRTLAWDPWAPFGLLTFVIWNAACMPWPAGVILNPAP